MSCAAMTFSDLTGGNILLTQTGRISLSLNTMIKYAYALCNDAPLNITDVTESHRNANKYSCICCGEQMIAHIKGKKKRHFKHYRNVKHEYETYLHLMAKKIIKQAYLNALTANQAVYIEYKENRLCNNYKPTSSKPCEYGEATNKLDITKTHPEIIEETYVGNFIPDLHLKSDKHPNIFIEIYVTHKCEVEKIQSGNKIIEVRIKKESDLEQLKQLDFSLDNETLTFYNFKTKTRTAPFCSKKDYGCPYLHYYIIHEGNGKYEIGYEQLGYVMSRISSNDYKEYILQEHKEDDFDDDSIYYDLIRQMRRYYKLGLKSCFECVNYRGRPRTGMGSEYFHCLMFNRGIELSDAVECKHYKPKERRY